MFASQTFRVILDGSLDGFSVNTLVEAIGKVAGDRIGLEWREGGFEVEFRHLETLEVPIKDHYRIVAVCVATFLCILSQHS